MKKTKVKGLILVFSIILSGSTLPSIVAAETTTSTTTVASIEYSIKHAGEVNSFGAYQETMVLIQSLPVEQQNKYTGQIAAKFSLLFTDQIKGFINDTNDVALNPNLKKYTDLVAKIEASTLNAYDKGYFKGQMDSWGHDKVYTPEVQAAINAVMKANVDKTQTSIDAAKAAVARLTGANNAYLASQIEVVGVTTAKIELTAKQIAAKYVNAVVYIEVSDSNHKAIASGSGFIVDSNGTVVTNFHVIEGCSYANVTLQNGTKYDVKSVLNYSEKQDIAILKLSNASGLGITSLGDSSTVELGDSVVAIGSPEGYSNTLSIGIISGINRKNDRGNDFQTTASITHGSSGGALFDIYGNVIGMTYSGYDSAGDIGFAIPSNEIKPFLTSINEKALIDLKKELYQDIIPTNVKVWAVSKSDILIQWDSIDGVDGYYVYYSEDQITWHYFGEKSNKKTLLQWEDGYTTSLSSIDSNTKMYFKIAAVKNGLEGDTSQIVNATTLKAYNYYPALSTVPQPVGISYVDTYTSDDKQSIYYLYNDSDELENNILFALEDDGWVYLKESTLDDGDIVYFYYKNDNLIGITVTGDKLAIGGPIH